MISPWAAGTSEDLTARGIPADEAFPDSVKADGLTVGIW